MGVMGRWFVTPHAVVAPSAPEAGRALPQLVTVLRDPLFRRETRRC